MRKWVILFLGFFFVLGIFAQIGFCEDGGEDECESDCSGCECSSCEGCVSYGCDDACGVGSLTSSTDKLIWYHANNQQNSYTFNSKQYYSLTKTFTNRKYNCVSCGSCGDGCGGTCCTDYCDKCTSNLINCKNWQECYDDDNSGCLDGSTGCECVDEYCAGWCMDNAQVYDGLASCTAASNGDWVIPSFPKPPEYILNTNYHSASMGGGCYCNYYEIKNHHECDSVNIKDSHPCQSSNCAPDFIQGGDYCCPSGQCAHLGLDVDILNGLLRNNNLADSVDPDLYCYSNGAVIQYQGDSLKCINSVWNFVTGDIEDFTDNCGKTIYNFPLFFNNYPVYPNSDNPFSGYKNTYLAHPLSFPGKTKDIIAYILPNRDFVKIQISKTFFDLGTVGDGDNKLIQQYKDSAIVKFSLSEDIQGEMFDYYIGCYTPKGYECNYLFDECWSNSYCSQDNPSNTASEDNDENKYYCCPKGTCAHKDSGIEASCYDEGGHEFSIDGKTCLWECKDEIWGKRDEGELCSRDCDCADLENINKELFCKTTLYNKSDKICCPEGKCGLKTGVCVEENGVAQSGEYKNCVCQGGTWHCKNILVKNKNSRILFSEGLNTYKTSLKLNTYLDKPAHITTMVFFDKKNYNGNVKITGTGDCDIDKTITLDEINNIFEESISSEEYTCELEITAPDLLEGQYFFYTGSALILEYTALI